MIKSYDKLVYVPINEITPYENNARQNEKAVEALVKAIPVMGFNVPVVLDRNKVIVKGHSRVEALKRLGVELVPCIIIDGDEQTIAEERLLDNKLSELSTWDDTKLIYELREMQVDLSRFDIVLPRMQGAVEQAGAGVVTKVAVEAAADGLVKNRQVAAEKKSFVEIHCPNCGEDFYADLAEVEKYAN